MKVAHIVPRLDPLDSAPMLLALLQHRGAHFAEQFVVLRERSRVAAELAAVGCDVYMEADLQRAIARLAGAELINAHCPSAAWGADLYPAVHSTGRPFLFTLYGVPFYRTVLPACCICVSATVLESEPSSIGAREWIEMGVDLERFQPQWKRRAGGRIVVTRLGPAWLHAEQLWWAVADVLARNPEVDIRIVGGRGAATGRVQAVDAGMDLAGMLAEADLVVAAPRAGEGAVTYGVMAAMAMGVPAALSDSADLRGCVVRGQTALVTPEGDTGALVAGIEALVKNAALRRRLGTAARERARDLDIRARVRQYEAVYARVLEDRRWAPAPPAGTPRPGLLRKMRLGAWPSLRRGGRQAAPGRVRMGPSGRGGP